MLIRKDIINGKILALNYEPQEVMNNHIFNSFLVLDFNIKLLQKKNPPDEVRLGIVLV